MRREVTRFTAAGEDELAEWKFADERVDFSQIFPGGLSPVSISDSAP